MVFASIQPSNVDMGFCSRGARRFTPLLPTNGLPNFFMFGEVYGTDEALLRLLHRHASWRPVLMDSVLDYSALFHDQ